MEGPMRVRFLEAWPWRVARAVMGQTWLRIRQRVALACG